ncbi:hypothetical protein KQX54_005920 [Cotesia glomerata]|uniref:Ig-like domain-containing protein n=1 Tax=Cotesia glomerata TaxID=32391 RepID=A0AAV7I7B3_COTGL|nr:hypothetical protein KQX54_005920 [Cotesia glomerata]
MRIDSRMAKLNQYDLETEKLYSVLWYKDNEEFYKYVNTDKSQHIYQVDGIKVDHRNSDGQRVILQRVNLDTTGVYKCEVSAEAPHFASTYGEAYMEVVVMPSNTPKITGKEAFYASGDILSLNCTSEKSHPPAKITWYINNVEVEADSTRTIIHRDRLVTTISTLRLELGPHHLSSGESKVKCKSRVETSDRAREALVDDRITEVAAAILAPLTQEKSPWKKEQRRRRKQREEAYRCNTSPLVSSRENAERQRPRKRPWERKFYQAVSVAGVGSSDGITGSDSEDGLKALGKYGERFQIVLDTTALLVLVVERIVCCIPTSVP